MTTTTTKSGAKVEVKKQRRYQETDIKGLQDGSIKNIDTRWLRKLLELTEYQIYFVAQQKVIDDLVKYEKIAKKAIADEIAQGGTGEKAKVTTLQGKQVGAQTFLNKSAKYTQTSLPIDGGTDEKGNPVTHYKTTETDGFRNHQTFISSFSDVTDLQLGHRTMANATIAAELYLGRLPKSDPRRDIVAKLIAGMRHLDKTQGEFLSHRQDDSVNTLESMTRVFQDLENLETIESVTNYTRSIDLLNNKGHIDYDAIFQPEKENDDMGRVTKAILGEIVKVIETGQSEFISGFKLAHVASSATFMRALKDQLIDIAIGKKPKSSKATSKSKTTKKLNLGIAKKNAKFKKQKSEFKKVLRSVHGLEAKSKGSRSRARGTGKADTLAPLMAVLNAKLPQTVAKNMGPPGLENQTGRFASSVHVTDVSLTAKGHPSIGYTYQKNPYQVFEMTHGDPRWATSARDPRKLIDASIREVATQFAIGRFTTRRL